MFISIILIFVVLISSCASPTSYQSEIDHEGYSEAKISNSSYQISYKGNKDSNQKRLNDFALLRAAELSLKNGYRYFSVLNTKPVVTYRNVTKTEFYSYPYTYSATEYCATGKTVNGVAEYKFMPVNRTVIMYDTRPYQVAIATPQVVMTIQFVKDNLNNTNEVIEANVIKSDIIKKYQISINKI